MSAQSLLLAALLLVLLLATSTSAAVALPPAAAMKLAASSGLSLAGETSTTSQPSTATTKAPVTSPTPAPTGTQGMFHSQSSANYSGGIVGTVLGVIFCFALYLFYCPNSRKALLHVNIELGKHTKLSSQEHDPEAAH